MKITITLYCGEDGHCPEDEVNEAIGKLIPGCVMSESIGVPDEWALLLESFDVEVVQ